MLNRGVRERVLPPQFFSAQDDGAQNGPLQDALAQLINLLPVHNGLLENVAFHIDVKFRMRRPAFFVAVARLTALTRRKGGRIAATRAEMLPKK